MSPDEFDEFILQVRSRTVGFDAQTCDNGSTQTAPGVALTNTEGLTANSIPAITGGISG